MSARPSGKWKRLSGEFTTMYGGPHMYHVGNHKQPSLCAGSPFTWTVSPDTWITSFLWRHRAPQRYLQDHPHGLPHRARRVYASFGLLPPDCYVSIKKRHDVEAKNVISAVLASDPFGQICRCGG